LWSIPALWRCLHGRTSTGGSLVWRQTSEPPKVADAKAWLDLFLAACAASPSRDERRCEGIDAAEATVGHLMYEVPRIDAFAAAQKAVL